MALNEKVLRQTIENLLNLYILQSLLTDLEIGNFQLFRRKRIQKRKKRIQLMEKMRCVMVSSLRHLSRYRFQIRKL